MVKSYVQAVIFEKKKWKKKKINEYLEKNDLKPLKEIHETTNYYRQRIRDPKQFKKFITKDLSGGIKVVIGFK